MKEKTNTSKLDTPLAHDKLAKTCTPKKALPREELGRAPRIRSL